MTGVTERCLKCMLLVACVFVLSFDLACLLADKAAVGVGHLQQV